MNILNGDLLERGFYRVTNQLRFVGSSSEYKANKNGDVMGCNGDMSPTLTFNHLPLNNQKKESLRIFQQTFHYEILIQCQTVSEGHSIHIMICLFSTLAVPVAPFIWSECHGPQHGHGRTRHMWPAKPVGSTQFYLWFSTANLQTLLLKRIKLPEKSDMFVGSSSPIKIWLNN